MKIIFNIYFSLLLSTRLLSQEIDSSFYRNPILVHSQYTIFFEPDKWSDTTIKGKSTKGFKTINTQFSIGYYKAFIPKIFNENYYIANKEKIITKNDFYLHAIGLYKVVDKKNKWRKIYGLRSIDSYTNPNNSTIWTYCLFEFNNRTSKLIKFKEQRYKGSKVQNFIKLLDRF